MTTKTLTVRVPEKNVKALDAVAEFQRRDRSFIVNEAIKGYLALEQYNREMIEEGIRDDDAGRHVSHEEVVASLNELSASYRARKRAS